MGGFGDGGGGQKIMVHPVEVEGTQREAAVSNQRKPEGEGVHTVMYRVVLV